MLELGVMRIAQLTPGSGDNFYCENCLRDAALVRTMRSAGHDVVMIPMYLPLHGDKEGSLSSTPIFFGGVNVYLQQKLKLFQKTPRWIDKVFDSKRLLGWVGKRAGMTNAKELGETTLSMLLGKNGRQVKELDRLIDWLAAEENKPDIVVLSNALLAGLAREIKSRLNVPVACLLQDEDGFLDGLGDLYGGMCWAELTERAKDIDLFISVSKYFAEHMSQKLSLGPDKVCVVSTGISLEESSQAQSSPKPPAIGYLSRMCASRGLDVLVEAFIELKKNKAMKNIKLRIAGGKLCSDEAFIKKQQRRLQKADVLYDVEFVSSFDMESKLKFLSGISVLSVPEQQPVAYGLYVLEALAAGVPVVEPAIGVFNELAEMSEAVITYQPNDAKALSVALEPLLTNAEYAKELGRKGKKAVAENFDVKQTAGRMIEVLSRVVA
jgi:glycosyltransferase involved in cell wall biosynthesis